MISWIVLDMGYRSQANASHVQRHKVLDNSTAFSPNRSFLDSGSDLRTARIWNIREESSNVLPITGAHSSFVSVVFSPDGP